MNVVLRKPPMTVAEFLAWEDTLHVPEISISIRLAEIYADVTFEPDANGQPETA